MIDYSFLPVSIWLLTTDLFVKLIVATVFPALVIGLGVKFMRNFGKN